MIYAYNQIRQLQIEGTTACNADCPMCIRRNPFGEIIPAFANQQAMTPDDYTRLLSRPLLAQLKSVLLCGNYGDPCLMRGFFDLIERTRINPSLVVKIETNGGMHNKEWWKKLARILNRDSYITFNIDGLKDTLGIYRRNVDYDKVIENATAFIEAGGVANWSFIPFAHNEHQVAQASEIAHKLGFNHFETRITERFYRNDGSELAEYVRGDTVLRPAKNPELRFKRDGDTASYVAKLKTCSISCRATRASNVYIDYAGNVFPCCFVSAIYGKDCEDLGTTMIRDHFNSLLPSKKPNLRNYTLQQIVEGPFFKFIADHFNTPETRPVVCSAVCGANLFKVSK